MTRLTWRKRGFVDRAGPRLRTILMTAAATVVGYFPLVLVVGPDADPVGGVMPSPWSRTQALSFMDEAGIDVAVTSISAQAFVMVTTLARRLARRCNELAVELVLRTSGPLRRLCGVAAAGRRGSLAGNCAGVTPLHSAPRGAVVSSALVYFSTASSPSRAECRTVSPTSPHVPSNGLWRARVHGPLPALSGSPVTVRKISLLKNPERAVELARIN